MPAILKGIEARRTFRGEPKTLSNTVQNAIIGDDNSVTGGLLGALTLLVTKYLVVRFLFRHRRLDQILEGAPTVLIDYGRVRHQALAWELLTESELQTVAHRQGFKHLSDIQRCVLEPGGGIFYRSQNAAGDRTTAGGFQVIEKITCKVMEAMAIVV